MSIYSRDYMKGPQRSGIPSPVNWSVVTWLLVVNITVFIIHHGFYNAPPTWASVLGLSIEGLTRWWLWTPVTYQFLHGHLFHLLGNMLVLFFLGRMLQREIPQRHVLRLYLLGGLVGGFFQLVWNLSLQRDAACVGASASVLAIAFALVTLRPNERLRLMLFFLIPVNLTFRTLGIILIVVNVFELIRGIAYPISSSAQIAVLAHFGGMFFGWFYMKQFTPQWDIGNAREGKKSFWDRFRIR
ncbi:MAG: rhomboid family intramembrane serine protease, partial [Verrucomicrobiota bacterium]